MKNIFGKSSSSRQIIFSLLLVVSAVSSGLAQVRLVADLQPDDPNTWVIERRKSFSLHHASADRAFYVVDDTELWTSDGSGDGTLLVREFLHITDLKTIAGKAYFTAFTQAAGYELWRSDGTKSGTSLFIDIFPGPGSAKPSEFSLIGELLYFSANNQTHGRELWKSDGTVPGTNMVKDISQAVGSSNPRNIISSNDRVFFSANDGSTGYELYVTDGTSAGTTLVKDIYTGFGRSSAPGPLCDVNGTVFFAATLPPFGRQLWKSDGTSAGTRLVKVMRPGDLSAAISQIVNVNGIAFFKGTDGVHGVEVWKSDGTEEGTVQVSDLYINPPGQGANEYLGLLDGLSSALGLLFFYGDGWLWRSDGTPDGTFQLHRGHPSMSTLELNGYALISANETYGPVLLRTDGITAEEIAWPHAMGGDASVDPMLQALNGKCYYIAKECYWATDGTFDGLTKIKWMGYPLGFAGLGPVILGDAGGTLYFSSQTWDKGLWKSDGSTTGTQPVADFDSVYQMEAYQDKMYIVTPDRPSNWNTLWVADVQGIHHVPINFEMNPLELEGVNGSLFLTCKSAWPGGDSNYGELWAWNTVSRSALQLKVYYGPAGTSGPPPRMLTGTGSRLFFTAFTLENGVELWKSDATRGGTVMVKDITPGTQGTIFRDLINLNGRLFFQVRNSDGAVELWGSDGAAEATLKIANVPGDATRPEGVSKMVATPSLLFYSTRDASGISSLWRSNGTTTGTIKLMDFPGTKFVSILGTFGSRVIFAVQTSAYVEIWKSDGTVAGTNKIRRLNNESVAFTNNAANDGQALYFTTTFPGSGEVSIWRTNGNYSGTYMIPFDGEVTYFGRPANLTASGRYVYFTGHSPDYGTELYLIDESTSAASIRIETPEAGVSAFPNPFTSDFILRVSGEQNEMFSVKTINGRGEISTLVLECNVDHNIGQSWEPGFYVVKIVQKHKSIMRKMIKVK